MCLLIKKDNICEVFLQQQKTQPTNEQASEINYWKEKKKKKKSTPRWYSTQDGGRRPHDRHEQHVKEDEDHTIAAINP